MCAGLSTKNCNGLWLSALWVEVPAAGAGQCQPLDRLRLCLCSLRVLQPCWEFLLSLLSAWTWGHGAAAALPVPHTAPDLAPLNAKGFHGIPGGWIKSNSCHLLLHLLCLMSSSSSLERNTEPVIPPHPFPQCSLYYRLLSYFFSVISFAVQEFRKSILNLKNYIGLLAFHFKKSICYSLTLELQKNPE